MSEQPTSEVYQEFSEKLRSAITVAMEVAELTAMRRMERAREAQAKSDAERAETAARLKAERDGAMPIMRQPWDAAWWRRAEPQEIAHVWQITSGWAGANDPYAKTTLEHMRRRIKQRYGIDVPDQPIPGSELAALLATPTQPRDAQSQIDASNTANEPEFPTTPQTQYRYVVRDAADPSKVLAQGTLTAHPAASPADVAVQGLREYARGGTAMGQDPAERMNRLIEAAYGRSGTTQDLSNVAIDIYPEGRTEGDPLYTLTGARVEAVRAERRAERQRVIEGRSEASEAEVHDAILLEVRATREELRDREARLREAVEASPEESAAAAEAVAQTRERLAELNLRREVVEANLRFEDGSLVVQAAQLRESLDAGWWETANTTEIAGVWDYVDAWSHGAAKQAAQADIRTGILRTHGVTAPNGASGRDIAAAIEAARDARDRNLPGDREEDRLRQRSRKEGAAATASQERAGGMADTGAPAEDVRAESEHAADMQAAAAQDRDAAAALADMDDREAADAIAVAAEGFSGTPSARLAASREAPRSQSRRPRQPRRSRDQQRGRGGR
jgi:hypothetical protein